MDDPRGGSGTGYLIDMNYGVQKEFSNVAASSRCLFDPQLGKAIAIKCYIGYNGRDSLKKGHVQICRGYRALVPYKWISQSDRRADAGFFSVVPGFKGKIPPLAYMDAPLGGRHPFLTVGYRGDRSHAGELGAQMYMHLDGVDSAELEREPHMFRYSMRGQAGSPLVKDLPDTRVAGTHCGQDGRGGYANVVAGKYGQNYIQGFV